MGRIRGSDMNCKICGKNQSWNEHNYMWLCDDFDCAGYSPNGGGNLDFDQVMLDQGVIPTNMLKEMNELIVLRP